MRRTWDAAARSGVATVYGTTEPVDEQVDALFATVGAEPRGAGLCVEIGCGNGRMTEVLAQRWPEVLAVDVSPAMLEQARSHELANVRFQLVSGTGLDGVADGSAQMLVCFGVLQHLPRRRLVRAYLAEFARVLAPGGEAIVQVPVLLPGVQARAWRLLRGAAIRARLGRGSWETAAAYRGARVGERELEAARAAAGLEVVARGTLPRRFPHAANVVLRLRA